MQKTREKRWLQVALCAREKPLRNSARDDKILTAEYKREKPNESENVEKAGDEDRRVFLEPNLSHSIFGVGVDKGFHSRFARAFDDDHEISEQQSCEQNCDESLKDKFWGFWGFFTWLMTT